MEICWCWTINDKWLLHIVKLKKFLFLSHSHLNYKYNVLPGQILCYNGSFNRKMYWSRYNEQYSYYKCNQPHIQSYKIQSTAMQISFQCFLPLFLSLSVCWILLFLSFRFRTDACVCNGWGRTHEHMH